MGRYMRKNKAAMEVSQSLGVRTRARTLAMAQQAQAQAQGRKNLAQDQQVNVLNLCYLELRSRKLEKPSERHLDSAKRKPPKTRVRNADAIGVVSVGAAPLSRTNSFSSSKPQHSPAALKNEELMGVDSSCCPDRRTQLEASCGDNAFDFDNLSSRDSSGPEHARRLRESTPACTDHLNNHPDAPGSSSKVRVAASARNLPESSSRPADSPSREEIEEFFAGREEVPEEEKRRLSDRYNYDFAKDCPLPGRFEWTPATTTSTSP